MKIEIAINDLEALLHAVNHIPKLTPNRWVDIAAFMLRARSRLSNSPTATTTLGENGKSIPFELTSKSCKSLYEKIICRQYPELLHRNFTQPWFENDKDNSIKPIVLMPNITECCNKNIRIRDPSFPVVYTENGTTVAALFHGQCYVCNTLYHYSFHESKGIRTYYNPHNPSALYFEYSSTTCFSKGLLEDFTNNITFSGATFKSRAQVYEASHRSSNCIRLQHLGSLGRSKKSNNSEDTKWQLSESLVENCWFLWTVINIYQEAGVLATTDIPCSYTTGNHRDLEQLCEECCKFLGTQPNPWIQHTCDVKGCKQGYITIDGNCKLRRAICAARGGNLQLGHNLPVIRNCCPNSPTFGNQSLKGSKYCHLHKNLDNQETSSDNEEVTDTQSAEQQEEDNFLDKVGCKKRTNIQKFYETTAGILALIKPCGIVVATCEMYTSESLTQVYLFLLKTYCSPNQSAEDFQSLRFLGYDRACQLHPFLVNEARKGSAGAQILIDNVHFLVDLFHCNKHTSPTCMPLEENPQCRYHPQLKKFEEIHGTNTNSCEQGFLRLNAYKYATRKMTQFRRRIFFHRVNNQYNYHLERKQVIADLR